MSEENASNKAALLAAQQKDEQSSEMMTELTAVSLDINRLELKTSNDKDLYSCFSIIALKALFQERHCFKDNDAENCMQKFQLLPIL